MRLCSLFISLLILFLSCMPCTDKKTAEKADELVFSQHPSEEHDHEHGEANDFCSPFCTCACCGASIMVLTVPTVYPEKKVEFERAKITSLYQSVFISSYNFSFWQPPKV